MENTFLPYLNREINSLTDEEKFSWKVEIHPKEYTVGILPENLKMLAYLIDKLGEERDTLKEKRNLEIEIAILNQEEVTINPRDKNHLEISALTKKINTYACLLWIEIREHFQITNPDKEMRIREGWKIVMID
ncbi:MAG: hypothetical protein Q8Q06_03180 [bacterium]|nr:hypothetical protein [bacterium]